ncbi:hypothetical protein SAMN02745221_01425 [Thermosyntropha lipolytica DSM 11003]|uniref:DNRLRE domain-containing protein n=1 Tax=Thermosyntropha lipolytica DSM 11003 TaxID=1123382 RepID=A0A1M5PAS1_9FIRM|nr:DNRLRE domain-containing protein [Thermosyntropha lipolytica]SHG98876.1 hypothetical protein SAMN02745221_01425 [Thermosyntropha lipolytica DSM 11003]
MNKVIIPLTKGLYISQYYAWQNFRSSEVLFAGRFKGRGDIYRSLLYCDLSYLDGIIPPGDVIRSACLQMHIIRNDLLPGKKARLLIYPLLAPWDENEVTWNKQPLFDKKRNLTIAVKAGREGEVVFDLTLWVREWYEQKSPYYGIMLGGEEDYDALIALAGLRFLPVSKRPALIINYGNLNY